MMRMKRALLAAGAVLASAAMSVSSYAQFSKTHNYADGMFSDVDAGAWYAPEVKRSIRTRIYERNGRR